MPSSTVSEQKSHSFKIILLALVVYGLAHLSPALPWISSSSVLNSLGPNTVLAQEDEEDEDEEDEEGEEEGGGEEAPAEEEAATGEEEPVEDENAHLYDIGPAKDIKPANDVKDGGGYSFPGLGNRKATWGAAQLHILFASFILGCPMFVVIMEVMGARRTQGVRKAIILANVFMAVLTGVIIGIIGEIIINIHHGVLYGMWACAFAALIVSFLNYFHVCMNSKVSAVVGAVVGAIFAYILVPVDHTTGTAIGLALLNGAVGGFLSTSIMFAKADYKFERLAHEVTKVIGFCYSFTALTGGLFLFIMMVAYKDFISYLVTSFPILFMIGYPTLFILETIVLYIYVYSWDPLNKTNKKGRHIVLGVV